MRFMMLVKASQDSGADEELLGEMGRFNEELSKAGVLLAGEGLHPTSRGARVRFSGERRIVADGPFPDAGEPVAGFWLIQAKSREEAVEWAKRCPSRNDGEIEVRQVFSADDFAAAPQLLRGR